MKLLKIQIERMIPVEEEEHMNVRFFLELEDPKGGIPFGLHVTVPVPLTSDTNYESFKTGALEELQRTFLDLAENTFDDLAAALKTGV